MSAPHNTIIPVGYDFAPLYARVVSGSTTIAAEARRFGVKTCTLRLRLRLAGFPPLRRSSRYISGARARQELPSDPELAAKLAQEMAAGRRYAREYEARRKLRLAMEPFTACGEQAA